jgi:hypothetical protein
LNTWKAQDSTNRNIDFGETTSQYSDGWIVAAEDLTLSAQRRTILAKTAFNELDVTYAADSLTVTTDPGKAFVKCCLARDESTNINLDADSRREPVALYGI